MSMTIQRYQEIKAKLVAAQEEERLARQELVERSGHTKKGSKTVTLDGFKVSVTNTVNTSIYEPGLDIAREKLGDRFPLAFRMKFDVNAAGWKELTDEEREIAEEAVVSKPGTPQLQVKNAIDTSE